MNESPQRIESANQNKHNQIAKHRIVEKNWQRNEQPQSRERERAEEEKKL